MIKLCRKCKVETERNSCGDCKLCAKICKAKYYLTNTDKLKSRASVWRAGNIAIAKETAAAYRAKNTEKIAADKKKWYLDNNVSVDARTKEWHKNNPESAKKTREKRYEKYKEYHAIWRLTNGDKLKAYIKKRTDRDPSLERAKNCAKTMEYHARKLNATPAWACRETIFEIYDLAQLRTKATGVKHDVDHIIPLRGKLVCGLHVENNLQVIPSVVNKQKSNKHGTFAGLHM